MLSANAAVELRTADGTVGLVSFRAPGGAAQFVTERFLA